MALGSDSGAETAHRGLARITPAPKLYVPCWRIPCRFENEIRRYRWCSRPKAEERPPPGTPAQAEIERTARPRWTPIATNVALNSPERLLRQVLQQRWRLFNVR